MAFTDNKDVLVFGAINEHGINRVAQLMMQERPSLFTYATKNVIATPTLLCPAISANLNSVNPEVAKKGDPVITEERPLPVLGTGGLYALDYAIQLSVVAIDFSPGSNINLPPPLAPQKPQRMALHIDVQGGVGLPPLNVIESITDVPVTPLVPDIAKDFQTSNQKVIPADSLTCFSVDLFVVGGAGLQNAAVNVVFDGLKITGIVTPEIEAIVETYAKFVVQLVVIPRLKTIIPTQRDVTLPKMGASIDLSLSYRLSLSPVPASVPNNPAFEDDEVKVFINATEVP